MADTQILPSATGGGLTRGAQGFVDARELNRERALNREKLDLEGRRITIQEQALDFNRLLEYGMLAPAGVPISDIPFMKELARGAFADLDPDTFNSVIEMIPTRETTQTIIAEQLNFFLNHLDPNNPVHAKIIEDMNFSALNIGVNSKEEWDLRRKITQITGEAFLNFNTDPRIQSQIVSGILELDPTLTVPGFVDDEGNLIEFDSGIAAQIYSVWTMNRDNSFTSQVELDHEAELALANNLVTAMVEAKIGLGIPKALQIVRAYAASTKIPEGEPNPLDELFDRSNPEVKQAIRMFRGAVDLGDTAFDRTLADTKAGRTLSMLGDLANFISSSEGMNISSDEMMGVLRDFLNHLNIGVKVTGGKFGRPRFIFENKENNIGGTNARDVARRRQGSNSPLNLPPDTNVNVIGAITVLRQGTMTEEALREFAGDEVVDAALIIIEGEK